jgi:TetR/AcrR family transcriptional regulator, transcriptional repressor for nem operon
VAEKLVQMHGFNGFSYADIAAKVKIRKASLHHHFATKAELGNALIDRYHQVFFDALNRLETEPGDAVEKLGAYIQIYRGVLAKNRMCLCGMLAADQATLPSPMRSRVSKFFQQNEAWVARLLSQGVEAKQFRFDKPAAAMAQHVISALEGAMLVARSHGGMRLFDTVADNLIRELRPQSN